MADLNAPSRRAVLGSALGVGALAPLALGSLGEAADAVSAPGKATTSTLLAIDGIKGEAADPKQSITIDSWSFGAVGPSSPVGQGSGAGAGKAAVLSSLTVTSPFSAASPALFTACMSGQHFAQATLTVRQVSHGKAVTALTVALAGVTVSTYDVASTDDEAPTEKLTLSYDQIKISYQPQSPDGSTSGTPSTGGWDITKNQVS